MIYTTDFEKLKNYKPPYKGTRKGMSWNIVEDEYSQCIVIKDKGEIVMKISCDEVINLLKKMRGKNDNL